MKMHGIKSSQIKEIGFDSASGAMAVRFNSGGLYHYSGVTPETFDAFKSAESPGSFFGANIKGKFDFKKITEKKGRREMTAKTTKTTKKSTIKDYRALRRKMDLNQTEFWNRLGVTQSGGCRYESGRKVPKAVAVLAHLVYVQGMELDARDFK